MESSTERIATKLNKTDQKHQGAVAIFINKCSGVELFSKNGIAFINETAKNLQQLSDDHKENAGASDKTQQTVRALESAISLLNEICRNDEGTYPNNNYKFFSESPQAKEFYSIVFPPGTTAPEITDDLAAKTGEILFKALNDFSAWTHLKVGVFAAYTVLPVNPIKTATTDIRERIDHYHEIGKDIKLVTAVSQIQNKMNRLINAPANANKDQMLTLYQEILTNLKEENFQFSNNRPPTGASAVAHGVLLPKLVACRNAMLNKFKVPETELPTFEINMPKPSDPSKFKDQLMRYCEKLTTDIDKYISTKKDIKEDKKFILTGLRDDIQQRVKEMQPLQKSPLPLADACLEIYGCVQQSVSEHHRVAGGKSRSKDLLNNAFAEVKSLAGQYTVNMTVASMPPAMAMAMASAAQNEQPKPTDPKPEEKANSNNQSYKL